MKAIVKFAKEDDRRRIKSSTLEELIEKNPNLATDELNMEIQNLKKRDEKEKNLIQFRKDMMYLIRLRRSNPNYKQSNLKKLAIWTRNYRILSIEQREELDWEQEEERMEELDKEIQVYLIGRDEMKKQILDEKCNLLGISLEEQIEATIKTDNEFEL